MRLKTRKRNIVVPHDPLSFSDAVVDVLTDAAEGESEDASIETILESANKVLDAAELDYSRYGEVLFEVAFAGALLTSGGATAPDAKIAPFCILSAPTEQKSIVPYIKWFQGMIRRRPFLVKALEATLIKLILSLEFYDDEGKAKVAISVSRCFALKVGILPDRVLPTALEDRLVARGTMASFITDFIKDFLSTEPVDSLVELLRRARLADRMLDFFPQQKRNWEDFEKHFNDAGLGNFVEYNRRKRYDNNCQELRAIVKELVAEDPPVPVDQVIAAVTDKKNEASLADQDVVKYLYLGITEGSLGSSLGKNTQQTQFGVLKCLKRYHKALLKFINNARLETALMNTIQVTCYEDSRLLKLFSDIIKVLYDVDVLEEDTIRFWYTRGSNPKGRNVFLKDMEPLIKWLDEAEEEDEEED